MNFAIPDCYSQNLGTLTRAQLIVAS